MEITQYYMQKNPCYTRAVHMVPRGIVVHDSSAGNPNLSRYIGPDDGVIGPNRYSNHWNKSSANKAVHAFIGRDKDGTVRVYNVLPWNFACWGCGSGKKGSYNADYIQFEILDDGYKDAAYFRTVWDAAADICATLCKRYGIAVDRIRGHYEAHADGYASDHSDPRVWFGKFGVNMDAFRDEVRARLEDAPEPKTTGCAIVNTPGDTLNVRAGAVYTANKRGELPHNTAVAVTGLATNGWVAVATLAGEKVSGWVNGAYLLDATVQDEGRRVNTPGDTLNVRTRPHAAADKIGELKHGAAVLTGMTANGWTVIKSGQTVGWVNAAYLTGGK